MSKARFLYNFEIWGIKHLIQQIVLKRQNIYSPCRPKWSSVNETNSLNKKSCNIIDSKS